MIEKITNQNQIARHKLAEKINEIIELLNAIVIDVDGVKCIDGSKKAEPDFITTTYVTDGHTKEYYGQKGAGIVIDHPLPAGYIITIREPETKGDDNE